VNIWKYVVDGFGYLNIEVSLILLLFLSFVFFLTRQIFTYLRLLYGATVKQRLVQKQRNYVFNHYIKANTSYHDSIHVGNLLNIIQTEVDRAVAGIMTPLELLVYLIMCLGYLVMLSTLSLQMTLLSVLVFLIVSLIPRVWIKRSKSTGRKLVKANTLMSEFLVGRLRSPRLVRLSGTENAEKHEFYRLTLTQRKHNVLSVILKTKTETVMEPIIIGLSLVLLYFSHTVLHLQLEVIGLYLVIAMRLMPIVKGILMQIQSIQTVLGSMEALEDRLNSMKDALEEDNGSEILTKIEKYILIDKVSFCYLNSKCNALKDITIKIEANKMTAIVGPSGGGKSTLIDLLPRLRLPTEGTIQIDRKNIDEYKLESLRKSISYVPQTPQIFNGTVKNHILYGKRMRLMKR
jgi:ABC-type multidrug transport system fused ATPase/permease subunit